MSRSLADYSLTEQAAPYCREQASCDKRLWKSFLYAVSLFSFLSACSDQTAPIPVAEHISQESAVQKEPRIGIILPLSGPHAAVGQRMRDATFLAMLAEQNPQKRFAWFPGRSSNSATMNIFSRIDIFDDAGHGGANKAAQDALAAGDKIVLGPIMAGSTEKVADILQPANIPELAFTSDVSQGRPGVWVMGLTPEQQVRRLVEAALVEGRQHFAAFLPDNALGHAFGEGLMRTCQDKGLEPPKIAYHGNSASAIAEGFDAFSDIAARQNKVPTVSEGQLVEARPADNAMIHTTDNQTEPASSLEGEGQVALPSFDALFLGDTGIALAHVIEALKADKIDPLTTRVMGPTLWKAFDNKLGDLRGAWYAAPDEQQRADYVQRYRGVYHQQPSPVTDIAYDAASLAKTLLLANDFSHATLTRSSGFAGIDGDFHLLPDGRVMRSLGIYQILLGGGAQLVVPASRDLSSVTPTAAQAALRSAQEQQQIRQESTADDAVSAVPKGVQAQTSDAQDQQTDSGNTVPVDSSTGRSSVPEVTAPDQKKAGSEPDIMLPPGINP